MIRAVPLPRWRDLGALAGGAPDPVAVAAPWAAPVENPLWFSRSSWAIHAMAAAWARRNGRPPSLWIPDYFCSATLGPVRRTEARISFYPVTPDLEPDWEACRTQALSGPPDIFLLAHYFGRPSDAVAAKEFCQSMGATLVEDAAHVMAPCDGVGLHGAFVLWSPHKVLAVPQGGLLVRHGDEHLAPSDVSLPSGPAPGLRDWLAKRLIQMGLPDRLQPPATGRGPQRFVDDPLPMDMPRTPALAPAGLKLLASAVKGLTSGAQRRRQTGRVLLEVLKRQSGWQPLFDPSVITPYRLVMRCQTPEIASERFDEYRRRGIPVESWPDMPPDVTGRPDRHAVALSLRATLLCFPVHQGIETRELAARAEG